MPGNAEGLTTATWPARQPTGGPPALKHAFQGREPRKAWTAADLERSIADVTRRSLLLPTWEPTPSAFFSRSEYRSDDPGQVPGELLISSPRPRAPQQRGDRVQEGRPEASEQRSGFALSLSAHSIAGRSGKTGRAASSAAETACKPKSYRGPAENRVETLSSVPPAEDSPTRSMTPVHPGETDVPSPPDPRTSDGVARQADRRGVQEHGPSRGRSAPQHVKERVQ